MVTLTQGDTARPLNANLVFTSKAPTQSEITSVTLYGLCGRERVSLVGQILSILDDTISVKFTPSSTTFKVVGAYQSQVVVILTNGSKQTFPDDKYIIFNVIKPIDITK